MNPGKIYLAQFPFGDAPGMKLRPVLVLTGPVGPIPEVLVAYISSVLPTASIPSDLLLDPSQTQFRATNLKVKSVLRLHKLATSTPRASFVTSAMLIKRPCIACPPSCEIC